MSERPSPFDDRAELYRKSGDLATSIATQHFKLPIDDLTSESWRELMGLLREVDTWADDTDVTSQEVLDALDSFAIFRNRYPAITPENLGDETHSTMLIRTQRILHLGACASNSTTPARFVAFRILEAKESANLFADTATPHVATQPVFHEEFIPTLQALSEGATLWDSLVDAREDYSTGKQILKPSSEYYSKVLGALVRRIIRADGSLMHLEPIKHIATKAGLRILNRVKNGIPEYSNLHRFIKHK